MKFKFTNSIKKNNESKPCCWNILNVIKINIKKELDPVARGVIISTI